MAFCDYCFRDKNPLQPIHPGATVRVCKACAYQIDRVIGFLRHSGLTIVRQSELTPQPPTKVRKGSGPKNKPLQPLRGSPAQLSTD